MRRLGALLAWLGLVLGAWAPPASADHGCDPDPENTVAGHGFIYCGIRWDATSRPVVYRVVTSTAPAALGAAGFRSAAILAAETWNNAWPAWAPGRRSNPGTCPVARPLCLATATTGDVENDGLNHVLFVDPPAIPVGVVAQAHVWSVGARIVDVDIALNKSLTWHTAQGQELVAGEAPGLPGPRCVMCGNWHDPQNVIAHELGHFLGLADLGDRVACWPADLTESNDVAQTMYTCTWPGETYKRSLDWGDVAGIQRIASDSR